MKKIIGAALIFALAILAPMESVEAWNGWTPVTIHLVQFDGTYHYAPVDMHDMANNSPLLISTYLVWESGTVYLPIVEDYSGDGFVPVTEDASGRIYIEIQDSPGGYTNFSIAIPILAYSDSHLGEDILNLPVLGNTETGKLKKMPDPPLDYHLMIPLSIFPNGNESYAARLIENPNLPPGVSTHNWVIPLIRFPLSSLGNNGNGIDFLDNTGGWDIVWDLGVFLGYVQMYSYSGQVGDY